MSAAKILPNYIYKDYEFWEGEWEVIDGIPYAMSPMPPSASKNICKNFLHFAGRNKEK